MLYFVMFCVRWRARSFVSVNLASGANERVCVGSHVQQRGSVGWLSRSSAVGQNSTQPPRSPTLPSKRTCGVSLRTALSRLLRQP